jgi:hypothetical protein
LQAPRCEAAYWLSGFIYDSKRKEWLRWNEVQELAATDSRLASYRHARDKAKDSIDGQLALARWASQHKLDDQARAHFTRVLEFNPNQAEARQRLGFRLVGGTWVGEHDMAEAQTHVRKASAAAAKWVPRLEKIRDRLLNGSAGQREKAREELKAIRDPEAVDAIDMVFCRQTGELALLGIELLTKFQTPQAAAVLARHATYSPWPQVRQAAATALRSQEKNDYVPLLVEAAQTPSGPQTPVAGSTPGTAGDPAAPCAPYTPGGESGGSAGSPLRMAYRVDQNVNTYTYHTIEQLKEHPYWWQDPTMRFNRNSPNPVAKRTTTDSVNPTGDRTTVQSREYYTVRNGRLQDKRTDNKVTVTTPTLTPIGPYVDLRAAQAAAAQQQANAISRFTSDTAPQKTAPTALTEATGTQAPPSPSEWWDWWYDDNEVYVSSGKAPKATHSSSSTTPAGDGSGAQRGDCLTAGTLVCTETGPVPVEQVVLGDRVFCCDPETGRLALKPVLQQTARPQGRLLKIRAGGEEFEASGGHVFWVAGRGWIKARDLREGMRLHTIRGTVPIEAVEPGTSQTSFSLIVADFHTFFAGKAMALTHDNTIRKPTHCLVPGLLSPGEPAERGRASEARSSRKAR